MTLIKLENICKTYFLGEISLPVLKDINLEITNGEYVSLMGVSGSGKSTLMNILGCLDRPGSGDYRLNGQEVGRLSGDQRAMIRNKELGFVFQNFNLLPRTSALDNVIMPLAYTGKGLSVSQKLKRGKEMLERLGLSNRMHHHPSQLSGGQQQRVAIARALINHPPLVFADEPTGNLDSGTSEEVLEIFRNLNQIDRITIILVTHSSEVAQHSNRVIHIKDGRLIQ